MVPTVRDPATAIACDCGASTATRTHPRYYGTFPRVLGHYAREEKLFSIEEGVRKMTSQAAQRAHLRERGLLREGMIADVVVFDPDTIIDKSTFEDPHHFSEGISDVIVNGVPVLLGKGALPGEEPTIRALQSTVGLVWRALLLWMLLLLLLSVAVWLG